MSTTTDIPRAEGSALPRLGVVGAILVVLLFGAFYLHQIAQPLFGAIW